MQAGQFMEPEKGRGGKSEVKTHSFFRQETLRPRTWRAGFSLPTVTALMTGVRPRQSTFLWAGVWACGQWPLNTTFVSSRKKECLEATAHALFSEQTSPQPSLQQTEELLGSAHPPTLHLTWTLRSAVWDSSEYPYLFKSLRSGMFATSEQTESLSSVGRNTETRKFKRKQSSLHRA